MATAAHGRSEKAGWKNGLGLKALMIIAASALAHLWCLGSQFYMDDFVAIVNNDALRDGQTPKLGLLTWTSLGYLFQYKLLGISAPGFHAVNWLLHTSVALVLLGFGRDFVCGRATEGVAWFGALLFAVHPLASEIPNYARTQDLAWVTLFSLLACWALLRFLRDGGWWKLAFVMLGIAGATMSKGPGIFHALMMTGATGMAFLTTEHWKSMNRWIWWLLGVCMLGLAALWLTGMAGKLLDRTQTWHDPRFIGHALTLARVFWEFAWRAVIPVSLCSDHHIAETLVPPGSGLLSIPDKSAIWAAAAMLGPMVFSIVLGMSRNMRLVGVCLFLFTATILFRVAYLIPEFMPEYRIYPGMPWFCLGASIVLGGLWKRLPGGGSSTFAATLVVLPCIALSAKRSFVWHDIERLTADVLKQYPTQVRALWTLQEHDTQAGDWRKVIDRQRSEWPLVFRRFLEENQRLAPARELPTGHLALADVACKGRYAQALAHVEGPAAGLAEIQRLEAYMRQLGIGTETHKPHWGYFFKSKALVLEATGNYQAALDLMRQDNIMDIRQNDIERVERKLRESPASP
jgi:hypothetical protein